MKAPRILLPLVAIVLPACGTPDSDGELTESPKPAFTGGRVWNVGGMTIGSRTPPTLEPIQEEPLNPTLVDAGQALSPGEPMPAGAAPTLDANVMPDGNPAEPAGAAAPTDSTTPAPQSPFDPALQNPPGNVPAPAPRPEDQVPPPVPPPAASGPTN